MSQTSLNGRQARWLIHLGALRPRQESQDYGSGSMLIFLAWYR